MPRRAVERRLVGSHRCLGDRLYPERYAREKITRSGFSPSETPADLQIAEKNPNEMNFQELREYAED
jgi:hypothetical protein